MVLVHTYDPPERFVAGTVGQPGQRTFFLQARSGARITSVALEKQQVQVLAERLDALLDDLVREGSPREQQIIPALAPHSALDNAPLEQPILEEFRVGTMTLVWDTENEQVVIEVFSVDHEHEEDPDDGEHFESESVGELLLVRMAPAQARAFSTRALQVVNAGRATCPFCGEPIDANGHLCVRANGFRRRP